MLYFTTTAGKTMAIPLQRIRYIQDHTEHGATIYTDFFNSDQSKLRQFRAQENTHELVGAFLALNGK